MSDPFREYAGTPDELPRVADQKDVLASLIKEFLGQYGLDASTDLEASWLRARGVVALSAEPSEEMADTLARIWREGLPSMWRVPDTISGPLPLTCHVKAFKAALDRAGFVGPLSADHPFRTGEPSDEMIAEADRQAGWSTATILSAALRVLRGSV